MLETTEKETNRRRSYRAYAIQPLLFARPIGLALGALTCVSRFVQTRRDPLGENRRKATAYSSVKVLTLLRFHTECC